MSIVPKIDLSGFDHHLVGCQIRLRNGVLEEPDRQQHPRLDPRPPSTPAMIQEAIRLDQRQLQGAWRVIGGSAGGRPGSAVDKVLWTLEGDRIVVETADRWSGKWTLDPSHSPKRINLAVTSSDGAKTDHIRGVYEVRGDTLCVCLAFGDEPRPETLGSGPGASQVSLVLKRQGR